MQIAAAVLG